MPLFDLLWAMLWFFLFIVWIWLLITVFIDIFRSDMNGWIKALWVLFVIIIPFLGVLIYLIVHGKDMQQRKIDEMSQAEQQQRDYIQSVSASGSADELEKLSKLHDQGALTDDEYAAQKAKVLNS